MKRRIGLWARVGFIVAGVWVILSFAIPLSPQPVLWGLVQLTCPIVPISFAFRFGVKWYWFIASNVAAYALIGLMVESLRLLRHRSLLHESPKRRGCVHVMSDPDRILDQMLEIFVEYDNWLTFRQLANRVTGDPSNHHVIAEVVHRHSRVFVVSDGCRCKLRTELIEDALQIAPLL
jgi:hypothetical protein